MVSSSIVWIQAIPGSDWATLLSIAALCSSRLLCYLFLLQPFFFFFFKHSSGFSSLRFSEWSLLLFFFFYSSLIKQKKIKNRLKNSHHLLLSELLTMHIPSLSSSALPSHCLLFPPSLSLSLSATVGEVLSFSLFLLPFFFCPSSKSNSYLVSHFRICFGTEWWGQT